MTSPRSPAARLYRVLGGEHAAPGLAEEVVGIGDAQLLEQSVEFVEEELDGPEVGALVGQMGGQSGAELVVVHHLAALFGDARDAERVVVTGAWSAVQDDQGRPAGLAGDPVPGRMAVEVDGAGVIRFGNRHARASQTGRMRTGQWRKWKRK